MTPTEPTALDTLYARVRDCHCKGLCFEACGPGVVFSPEEQARVIAKYPFLVADWIPFLDGFSPLAQPDGACAFLSGGRCTIYADRPLVCRAFGSMPGLACPFCEPTMTPGEEYDLMLAYEATFPRRR